MKQAQPDPTEGGPLTLVVAAPLLVHPACGNGGGVLTYECLARLSEQARVHFLAFGTDTAADAAGLKALQAICASVTVVAAPRPRPWMRGPASALQQVFTGVPREVRDWRSPAMRAAIADAVARWCPAVVMLQFPHMAQYADACPGVPVLIDVQDVYAVSRFREWRSGAAAGERWGLRGLLRLHTWWAWARYELHHYAQAQRLMAISEADRGVLAAYLPEVPAFLSPVAWHPVARAPQAQGQQVLFMGNFAHAPNADGLHWLLQEVWPQVVARCPAAQLHVVGRHVPKSCETAAPAGVVVRGYVPDVAPLLHSAAVSLVPYRFGGGIKIKAIEAMAAGCPVLATTVGSEGLAALDGVHLRVADGTAAFAAALIDLLQAPAARHALAEQALALVRERWTWASKIDRLMVELRGMAHEAHEAHHRQSVSA